jgi:hypothetical protein
MAAVITLGLAACDPETIDQVETCIEDPSLPECQPDQLLADQIVSDWDGSMEHIELAMEEMDFSEAMTQTMTFDLAFNDGYENVVMSFESEDRYVFGEYVLMQRIISEEIQVDGENIVLEAEVIYKEVETGVHVYVNIAQIKSLLAAQGGQEVVDGMNALGLEEDWVLFKFDDSLANIIEIEVLKDMLVEVFFKEVGANFFYDLQDEVELELGFDFEVHGLNLGLFVDYILNDQFEDAELMLENIDFELLLSDFELNVIAPAVADELMYMALDIEAALPGIVVADEVVFLNTNGFFAWVEQLTDDELEYYITEAFDAETYEIYTHHQAGTLDHFIIMTFLNDPYNEADLREIPGFDFDLFKTTMDNLDYDAFYMETVELEMLFAAIYGGQDAFDGYLDVLTATAPETASILEAFSGTVLLFEDVVALIEDIEMGFENLSMFSEYFTMDYYVQNNMATIDVTVDENQMVNTEVEFSNYGELAVDVLEDAYWYLDGFSSFEMPYVSPINCPITETCEQMPLYDIQAMLNQFGPVVANIAFDPVENDIMIMSLDLAPVLAEFAESIQEESPIDTLEITMTLEEGAVIQVPTDVSIANDVAADFAKFSIYFVAWDLMDDLKYDLEYYGLDFNMVEGVNTIAELDLNLSKAFDADLSTITIGGTAIDPTFSIELVWIDGTNVFTEAITLAELDPVIGNGSGAPDAVEYATYLAKIDAENFNLTKLFLVYLLEEDDYYYEEYPEDDYYN